MRRAKGAMLILCLFVLYCVLLSQGLKATPVSTFFGALAAVPLTVYVYHRLSLFPTGQGAHRHCIGGTDGLEVEAGVTDGRDRQGTESS